MESWISIRVSSCASCVSAKTEYDSESNSDDKALFDLRIYNKYSCLWKYYKFMSCHLSDTFCVLFYITIFVTSTEKLDNECKFNRKGNYVSNTVLVFFTMFDSFSVSALRILVVKPVKR